MDKHKDQKSQQSFHQSYLSTFLLITQNALTYETENLYNNSEAEAGRVRRGAVVKMNNQKIAPLTHTLLSFLTNIVP